MPHTKKSAEKERLVKATEELKTAVLPVPKEIKKEYKYYLDFENKERYIRHSYVEHISERKGYLLQRVFCMQVEIINGERTPSCREMSRRYENGNIIVCNLYCKGMMSGGYIPYTSYSPDNMHESGWIPDCTETFKNKNWFFVKGSPCVNEKYWLKKYPHCAWEEYRGYKCLFDYLVEYRKDNRIEYLVKAGYDNFVGSKMINKNGKSFESIFKIKQSFAKEYLKIGTPSDLSILRNNEKIDSREKLIRYKEIKSQRRWADVPFSNEEIDYLIEKAKDVSVYEYADYLRFAKELGYPLNENRYHFPKDFKTAHDTALELVEEKKNKKYDKGIKSLSNACKIFTFEKDGFIVFPLSCANDLIYESKVLCHCVRTYVDKVANHESLILFVRKIEDKDTPFVTIELVKSSKKSKKALNKQFDRITQVYGVHDTKPDEATCKFVMDWKKKFNLKGWAA